MLKLAVIGWIIRSFSVFLAIALVVIFQPELRRALAELGGHPIFSLTSEKREIVHDLAEAVTQLASKQFGALIAIERDTSIRVYEETGVQLEADFSVELLLTIFHPKTALHDGGVIVRNGRVAAAACIFPVSQRETLDRSLGLRHRAGLGLTEESDAVAVICLGKTGGRPACSAPSMRRLTMGAANWRLRSFLTAHPADGGLKVDTSDRDARISSRSTKASRSESMLKLHKDSLDPARLEIRKWSSCPSSPGAQDQDDPRSADAEGHKK